MPGKKKYEYKFEHGEILNKYDITGALEKYKEKNETYDKFCEQFSYPKECGKGYQCDKLTFKMKTNEPVDKISAIGTSYHSSLVLYSYFNNFAVQRINDNGFLPGEDGNSIEIEYELYKSSNNLSVEIGMNYNETNNKILFKTDIAVGGQKEGAFSWEGKMNQGGYIDKYISFMESPFYVRVTYMGEPSIQEGLSVDLDAIMKKIEEEKTESDPVLKILKQIRDNEGLAYSEGFDLKTTNAYINKKSYKYIRILLRITNTDCEYDFEKDETVCNVSIDDPYCHDAGTTTVDGEETGYIRFCDWVYGGYEDEPYGSPYSFYIYTNAEDLDDLEEYLFASDYKTIEEDVFGDLKTDDETEMVIESDNYLNKDGNFIRQVDDCDCFCTAKKYTGTNPQNKNYLFNKVYYKPSSENVILTNDNEIVEKKVLAKNNGGVFPTLIDTYEIVSFEKSRLKEAILEIDNRLEQNKPTMVGVTYGAKEKPYNKPGYTTDHYMVIIAKGRDAGGIYFRYLDPGTRDGKKADRKLYIDENLIISGDCPRNRSGDTFYVVEIRLEDKMLPSCITDPDIDPLIKKMIDDYDAKNKKK